MWRPRQARTRGTRLVRAGLSCDLGWNVSFPNAVRPAAPPSPPFPNVVRSGARPSSASPSSRLAVAGVLGSLLLAGLTLLLSAGPAAAHAALLSTTPKDGATVSAPLHELRLTFDEPVQEHFDKVAVAGPSGQAVAVGTLRFDGPSVIAPLGELPTAGRYTVAYRMVSDDGHVVSGSFTFTAAGSAVGPASATPLAVAGGGDTGAGGASGGSTPAATASSGATAGASDASGSGSSSTGAVAVIIAAALVAAVVVAAAVHLRRRPR